MTEKPKAKLRPLKAEDIEIVAAFERDIAAISFPDDPITDLAFYKKKVGKLIDDRNAATFVADDGTGPVGWAYVSKRQNFITKESYADEAARLGIARRLALAGRNLSAARRPIHLKRLRGTLGTDPLSVTNASNRPGQKTSVGLGADRERFKGVRRRLIATPARRNGTRSPRA